jgi:hypothetical protein
MCLQCVVFVCARAPNLIRRFEKKPQHLVPRRLLSSSASWRVTLGRCSLSHARKLPYASFAFTATSGVPMCHASITLALLRPAMASRRCCISASSSGVMMLSFRLLLLVGRSLSGNSVGRPFAGRPPQSVRHWPSDAPQRHITGMRCHARRLLSAKQGVKIALETTTKSLII